MNILEKLKAQKEKMAAKDAAVSEGPAEAAAEAPPQQVQPQPPTPQSRLAALFGKKGGTDVVPAGAVAAVTPAPALALAPKLKLNLNAPQTTGGGHPALVEGANYQQRLLGFIHKMSICQPHEVQPTLLRVVDMMTEIMAMEHEQVGTAWNQQERGKYDIPVLGEALKVVADRFNKYSVHVLEALVNGPVSRLQTLSDGADPRTIAHVIAAAAQLIAEEQVNGTQKATKAKREARLTEAERMAMSEIGLGDDGAFSGGSDPFAAIFGADLFIDGKDANKDKANALAVQQTISDDAEVAVKISANLSGNAPPARRLFASKKPSNSPASEDERRAGGDDFSLDFDETTLGQVDLSAFDIDEDDEDYDADDPFASLG